MSFQPFHMIEYLIAAYLGILQGLTEFLPVSSSGHLALSHILSERFGITMGMDDIFFDVLLHVATLLVVLGYYKAELAQFVREWLGGPTGRETTVPAGECKAWTGFLLVSTLITMALALPFKDRIETAFDSPMAIGAGWIYTATILSLSWYFSLKHEQDARPIGWKLALVVGLFQAVAVLPGISRSGSTIAAALLCGASRKEAVTYSFLLSIPAILGGALLEARDVETVAWGTAAVGFVCAMIAGWFALSLLVKLVIKGKLIGFAIYCLILGVVTLIVSVLG